MNLDATKKKIEGLIQYICFETYYDKDKNNEEGYFSVHCRIDLKYPFNTKSFECQVISLYNKTEGEAKEEAFNHLICEIGDCFTETFNELSNQLLTSLKTLLKFYRVDKTIK